MSEATSDRPRAYGQWVIIYIKNSGSKDIKITNLDVSWGKLYADGDKDDELSTSTVNNTVIHPSEEYHFNACGRENSPSGTTGTFDIVDVSAGDANIRHCHWDCPWGSHENTWTVSGTNTTWMCESKGANLDSGALGTIYNEMLNKS